MDRQRPPALWVGLVALGLISLAQLGASSHRHGILLISVGLNVVLLIGLYSGHRWAYVLTLFFCVAGAVAGFASKPSAGLIVLIGNGFVAVPVILSTKYFWVKAEPTGLPDPLRCPTCGYSLLGLTEPRCPECGQEFKMPG